MRRPARVFWPIALTALLADCTSKRAVEEAAPGIGVPRDVVDDVLRVTLHYNPGAAFSMRFGPYQRWLLIGLALAMLVLLAHWYRQLAHTSRVAVTALALITGGAVGNLLDRLISARGVVDWIDVGVGANRFYLFNIADACVSVGAVLLIYALWRMPPEHAPQG